MSPEFCPVLVMERSFSLSSFSIFARDASGSTLGLQKLLQASFPDKRIFLDNEDYAEFTYADGKVTVVSYAYGYADSTGKSEFEVNGQAADKDTFVSVGQGIIDKAANDFQVTGRLDEDYEAVISNYKE